MEKRIDLAIIGVQSSLGEALLDLLARAPFALGELYGLASSPDLHDSVEFMGQAVHVEDAESFDYRQVPLAILAENDPRLVAQAERAADAGCVVIDASGHVWRDPAIPVVIPEINAAQLAGFNERGLVAGPDPLVVPLTLVIAPLLSLAQSLRRIDAVAMVPVSDGPRTAFQDLARETTALLNARAYERRHFPRQIAFNLHAQIGEVDVASGLTEREQAVATQLAACLDLEHLACQATLVQAPVFYGYGIVLTLQFDAPVSLHELADCWPALGGQGGGQADGQADAGGESAVVDEVGQGGRQAHDVRAGVQWLGHVTAAEQATPVTDATQDMGIRVSRLRLAGSADAVSLWITADNVRRCTAWNAVQTAGRLVRDYL